MLKAVAIAFLCFGSVEAQAGFSSSSRSFSSPSRSFSSPSRSFSSPSRSFGSSSKSYTAPSPRSSSSSAKSTTTSSGSWFSKPSTAKPQTSSRPVSSVDTARYKSAVSSGKVFQTRESAIADFKATKASSYTSKFTSEPKTRPDYIPQSYKSNDGKVYNITYNQQSGGYGYWSGGGPGLGTWMMYDMMSDAIMMNTMMNRSNYYVGPPPATTVVTSGSGIGTLFLIFGGIILAAGIIFFIVFRNL